MSSGLYSGVSGLAIGSGLYKGVSGLWSGAAGLVTGWGNTIWSVLGSGLTVFHDLNNTPLMKDFEGGIAAVGDPVAIVFDSATWYGQSLAQVIAAAAELKAGGVIGLAGTATAATYNTETGVGTVTRAADVNNQSYVQWSGLAPQSIYYFDIQNTGATDMLVRHGPHNTNNVTLVLAGVRKAIYGVVDTNGLLTLTTNSVPTNTVNFTLHAMRLIPGYHMSQFTLANRPILRQNGATGAKYLECDGVDDFMVTRALDLTGTNKLAVFTGQRQSKLFAGGAVYLESSTNAGANSGAFHILAPGVPLATYAARSRGTASADVQTAASYTAPDIAVLSLLADIGGPSLALRVDGTATTVTMSQGTGNYGDHALYYFARAGTSLFFTGDYYGDIVYVGTPSTAQIEAVEAYYNALALPPQLQLSFTTGALDSRITFTRSSTATYTTSAGLIASAATNTPRFDYDPLGNLITYSAQLDNVAWAKSGVTVGANVALGPDGTYNADGFVEDTTTGGHLILQTTAATISDNTPLTASWYVKAVTRSWCALTIVDKANVANRVWYDVSTGTQGTTNGAVTSFSATDVGNGWYRLTLTASSSTGATLPHIRMSTGTADDTPSYTGTGATSLYLWGAQLQEGSTATTYIPTTATAPLRTIKGLLLESQSTNLLTYSEQFDNAVWSKTAATVTADAVISPSGATNADKLVEDTSTSSHLFTQNVSGAASTSYTYSIYAKAAERTRFAVWLRGAISGNRYEVGFDLSTGTTFSGQLAGNFTAGSAAITPVGNGWYRCTVTATTGAGETSIGGNTQLMDNVVVPGNTSYTGDGTSGMFFWGAQLEALGFASSYIPTVAGQVTRARDDAIMVGSNLTSWYNQSEGTLVSEHVARLGVDQQPFAIDLASTHLLRTRKATSNIYSLIARDPTNRDLTSTPVPALTEGQIVKIAGAYATNDLALSGGGQAVSTGSVFTPFTPTQAAICTAAGTSSVHVRSVAYYNRRLTNAQLQALTV